jgi:hypothetical protein
MCQNFRLLTACWMEYFIYVLKHRPTMLTGREKKGQQL